MLRLGSLLCHPLLLPGRLLLPPPSVAPCRGLAAAIPVLTLTSSAPALKMRAPPVAKKVRHEMTLFGDTRVDEYYWLRDDSRSDKDVLQHLKEENEYTNFVMADTKQLEKQLFEEIKGRIQEDDISVPLRRGSYYYYTRNQKGKEYVQHCRRRVPDDSAPVTVHNAMPTGPDAPPEHIILDENVKAQDHAYYAVDAFKVSPNNKLVAYAEDTKGNEIYTIYVIDAETRSPVAKPLAGGITSCIEWAGDETLVYITMDETTLRPNKVWAHKLGHDQSNDQCLYHEKDDAFSLDLQSSESKEYLFVGSESKKTRFVFYLDISNLEKGLLTLTPRINDVDTSVSHRGNYFFIKRRTDEYYNSELLACPVNDVTATMLLLPHRESVKIQDIHLFSDHIVIDEREGGLPRIVVYSLPPVDATMEQLQDGRVVDFIDPIYTVWVEESQFSSSILRYHYSSMRTPPSIYDYDMRTGISILKKIEQVHIFFWADQLRLLESQGFSHGEDISCYILFFSSVLGGFESSNYVTERIWAPASDGTQIPISLVYKKKLVKLDGSDPLLLYGYGSYEICIDPGFKASRLSLLDRGFIYAIAHIRGGGEMGRPWYENGKMLKKSHTFTDFITCAEYLIDKGYCTKEKLCINGRSAGGLLIGSVLNMRPDLFKAAVAGVPFVDIVTTMLDPTIPLTTSEWEEWGDPREEQFYFYMKSYSPVDNIKPQSYPHILVTAGLNDPRVLYSEPAKYVAKLRELKTDNNILLFKCEMGAGHFSKSGRFEKLQEDAFTYAFLLKALDMIPSPGL